MKHPQWTLALGLALALAIAVMCFVLFGPSEQGRLAPIVGGWTPFALVAGAYWSFGRRAGSAHGQPSIEIRIAQAGGFDERFVIENASAADAYDVDLKVVGENQNPIPTAVAMHHLPVGRIPAGGRYEIPISLSADAGVEFDVVAVWKNKRGKGFKVRKWIGLPKSP